MYSLNMPVSKIRTKIRQEFERHRFVNKLSVVDVLLTQCHMEFQVGGPPLLDDSEGWTDGGAKQGNVELLEADLACHEVLSRG